MKIDFFDRNGARAAYEIGDRRVNL